MLETHRKRCYRKRGGPRKLKPCPKHPVKVHVWGGGISKRGTTGVAIFTRIMMDTKIHDDFLNCVVPDDECV